ncbi:amidohydrolase family protein [Pseudonocardia halophobica]|uniref:amidohydrolase family protein n=1 Tax=Pseudonocardia halophobica TaxID=29401 RepID=UPI003D8D7FE8
MIDASAVDVHAHHLGTDLTDFPGLAPRLVVDDAASGRILCGEATFRKVTSVLWSVPDRLAEMDRAKVSHQVVSPVPVTMEFAAEPDADPAYARAINDSIAAACAGSEGRLLGLGILPFGTPDVVVGELERCTGLGLRGVEVGTRIGELDLDAPELADFWAASVAADVCVFVHPVLGGTGVVRRPGQPFDLGLGMLADTAIAASSLVFGGILERHPDLRVALAHGCGAFPWAYPRLRVAAGLGGEPQPELWDALTRRLYADSLVFDDEHLRLLVHRFGADRLLLGSDAPFFPDQLAKSMAALDSARASGALPPEAGPDLLARNALEYLGLAGDPSHR